MRFRLQLDLRGIAGSDCVSGLVVRRTLLGTLSGRHSGCAHQKAEKIARNRLQANAQRVNMQMSLLCGFGTSGAFAKRGDRLLSGRNA
ncbi:MAG: hypothetical protein ACREUQ_14225 [Burkholderiales bacterium]